MLCGNGWDSHLVVIEQFLVGFDYPLCIDGYVLDTIHADNLCVAVGIAAVIDESSKASLRHPRILLLVEATSLEVAHLRQSIQASSFVFITCPKSELQHGLV